jgi:hypothetical protein
MLQVDEFEKIFTDYFQKNITLRIGDEILKSGKFLLVQNHVVTNNFYFELVIENTKKIVSFKIPYPFSYDNHPDDGLLYLDYRFTSLTDDGEARQLISNITSSTLVEKPSKFLNNILEIQFS